MGKYVGITLVVGVLAIATYFIFESTSQTTEECAGDWTDNFNPACWVAGATTTVTNELNKVLLILGAVAVIVVGLLAFGPSTGHIAGAASKIALL